MLSSALSRTLRALRHRNFRLFFFGQMVSLTGSWMQGLAQGWLVWRLTQSTFLLGLVGFAQLAPVLLLGLVGGVAADRFERRRIVLATQVVALAQSVALAALTLSGRITVGQVLALATVMGVVNAFDFPGRQSLISELVEREDLGNAIALNSTIFNGARIVGPSLAGAIVAAWGEGTCFAINAVSYLAVIASLLAMRFPARPAAAARDGAWRGLLEGVAYARRTPHVRALLGLVALTSVFGMSYLSFLPAFAGGVLERGPGGLGLLMGSVGAGAVVGALSLAWRRGIRLRGDGPDGRLQHAAAGARPRRAARPADEPLHRRFRRADAARQPGDRPGDALDTAAGDPRGLLAGRAGGGRRLRAVGPRLGDPGAGDETGRGRGPARHLIARFRPVSGRRGSCRSSCSSCCSSRH